MGIRKREVNVGLCGTLVMAMMTMMSDSDHSMAGPIRVPIK